ncbi:MAG: IS110 family transposase [Geminicoccaceae bacterium]
MSVTMIGLDTAKAVFHVHGIDEAGKALVRRKLRRQEVIGFFEAQPTCTVVLETCGAAHHWGRVLTGLGHTVKLIAPEAVRPFVKRGRKNDAVDAAALCEAARRPEVKFVPVKGLEQQAMLALHAARALLVKQQTMLANALRSLVAEFGVVAPLGLGKLGDLVAQVEASLPGAARQALSVLQRQFHAAGSAAAELEASVVAHARQDGTARRLATIPGVGPITASLIAATVVDASLFKSARCFAAWLGLVPRQHSTGGKPRLGRITKAGNEQIRTLLVLGATSMVRRAGQWNSAAGAWVRGVLARRPARLATVALANKMARIVWALMAHEEDYRSFRHLPAAVA